MLTQNRVPSSAPELGKALAQEGEEEYRQLLRVVQTAQGRFFLYPIESDFSPALRDAFLARLCTDLAQRGIRLRLLALDRTHWDPLALPEMDTPVTAHDVFVLTGLEETPGLFREGGAEPQRPATYALLNHWRETLRGRLSAPLLVWCTPLAYNALLEHAPDFFDHYAALFQFLNAVPEPKVAPPSRESGATTLIFPLEARRSSRTLLEFYERQLATATSPLERARALLGLAEALREERGTNWIKGLLRACDAVEEALSLLSPQENAYDWARGQHTLGNILSDLPFGNQEENLRHAIACYRAALYVYTEADFPTDWAMTQNNLGVALGQLLSGNQEDNIGLAIACFEAALRVYTKPDFPTDWATTQNNLGNAYTNLAVGSKKENLERAIACYRAALSVQTEADFPIQWATTQNNLGNAYGQLPSGNREENLYLAIACYEAALRVRTKADHLTYWADTQVNYGIVLEALGDVEQARSRWQEAARVFRECGMEPDAQRIEAWLT